MFAFHSLYTVRKSILFLPKGLHCKAVLRRRKSCWKVSTATGGSGRLGSTVGKEDTLKKRATTDAKASANRRNARMSTGPRDTSSTRLNATRHGLLSEGITELDDAEGYRDFRRRLQGSYFDEMEAFLV